MSVIRTFEDLECWKACRQLRVFVMSEVVKKVPREERFELANQLRRAARSVTVNIAEGFGRFHYCDNYKFCSNARGSLFEVLDHLITSHDDGFISSEGLADARVQFKNAVRILNGYMKYLQHAGQDTAVVREESDSCVLPNFESIAPVAFDPACNHQ